MIRTDPTRVVHISPTGQTTIPKELRKKHGLSGRVRFRETENALVLEAVPHPDEKLGSRADHVRDGEVEATLQWLRDRNREQDGDFER